MTVEGPFDSGIILQFLRDTHFFFFEREREREKERVGEGHRDGGQRIRSRLCTDRGEPGVALGLMIPEIMT